MNFTNYNDRHITEIENRRNWTDPIVVLDPKITSSNIVKAWQPDNSADAVGVVTNASSVRVDGVRVPILKINNTVVDDADIVDVMLRYESFLPYINITIRDNNGMQRFNDTPGFSNVITLIMTMPGNVTYKKVSIDFYITSWECYNNYIYCSGEYKCLPLELKQLKQIKCVNSECKDKSKLTTWDMLWQIATDTGLGFASSPKDAVEGKPIPDDGMYRICSSIKYKDYIKQEIQWAGNDENEFMDAWVDLNGYIVLSNVSWIFDSKVDTDELIIKTSGDKMLDSDDMPDTDWIETCRTLTNHPGQPAVNSMSILEYEDLSDNADIYYKGALRSYSGIEIGGAQQENTSTTAFDVELEEKSRQGIEDKDEFQKFQRAFFTGIEMSVDKAVLKQRALREEWFRKKRMRRLKVSLQNLNLGLQRGTLVNVMIYETDKQKIRKLIDTFNQQMSPTKKEDIDGDTLKYTDEQNTIITKQTFENNESVEFFPNYNICGMYYIDTMEFEYTEDIGQWKQTLFLIKKDELHTTTGDKYIYPSFQSGVIDSVKTEENSGV